MGCEAGVNVGLVGVVFSGWILSDVVFLGFEVVEVADPVFVVAGVPDFAWKLLADDEGVAAFDEGMKVCDLVPG